MGKWGLGQWIVLLLFTWWIPFSIYGYFTREDSSMQQRVIPELKQEEKNKVYAQMCAEARWEAQRSGLVPKEVEVLKKTADTICGISLRLIKPPAETAKQ